MRLVGWGDEKDVEAKLFFRREGDGNLGLIRSSHSYKQPWKSGNICSGRWVDEARLC